MQHASLNHIYRVVWSLVLNTWVAVSEITRGRGKSSSPKLVAAALSLTALLAQAAPSGGQIMAGAGSVSQSGNTTTVQQTSQNLSLNWNSFNIAPQETVNFLQPSASALAVNRIFDTNGTQILGHLNANGQIYLINPNGILFGQGAQVNVGGLVASSLDVNDASLGGTTRSFSGKGSGSVVNQGTIHAADGGYVALLGNQVSNQGVITARLGTVALGAGSAATLTFSGDSLLHLQVDQSVLGSLAANGGLLQADGGQVLMSAGAKNTLLASVVNNTGVIEARTVDNRDGTIVLLGGMQAGQVNVGGTLDASAPSGGNGGFIETSAAHVNVAKDTKVTTLAASGQTGTWLIDPQDYTVAASNGDITGATLSNNLANSNVTLQSSSGGTAGSGDININDTVSWSANTLTLTAANNVNINAVMTATGSASLAMNPATANGADAAVAGSTVNVALGPNGFTGRVDFSGGGTLSINGTPYTVINSLGVEGDVSSATLQGMNGNMTGNFVLGSNIDASSTSTWNAGAGFSSILQYGVANFSGKFDGLGHIINNLTINRPTEDYVGLFGANIGSIVRNVGIIDSSVIGRNNVGILAGYDNGAINNSYTSGAVNATGNTSGGLVGINFGTIDNSRSSANVTGISNVGGLAGTTTVTGTFLLAGLLNLGSPGVVNRSLAIGTVTGSGDNIGGLIGNSFDTSIRYSYATGDVIGRNSVGGLVGWNGGAAYGVTESLITNSYASGHVTGSGAYIGGLVGLNGAFGDIGWGCRTPISNSYAIGSVSGATSVGGLVGANSGAISNTYATGTVTFSQSDGAAAGLVGLNHLRTYYVISNVTSSDWIGTVANSFWDISSTGQSIGSLGGNGSPIGMTTAEMQQKANFTSATTANSNINPGWDFSNAWIQYDGHSYPLLRSFLSPVVVTARNDSKTYDGQAYVGGNGVVYSSPHIFGTVSYEGSSQGATNAGTYAITPSGLYSDQQGYIIQYADGTLTINKALLTATVNASDKVYDGTTVANPMLLITAGLVGMETISAAATGSFNSKDVATANVVTVNNVTLTNGTGLASNYSLATGQTAVAHIIPKPITATFTAADKVYDGSTAAIPVLTITAGLVGTDTVAANGTASFNSKDVATANLVTVDSTTLTNGTGLASNYSLAAGQTVAAHITPKPLNATVTAPDKVYDGTTVANPILTITAGLVGTETVTASGSASFNSKDVTSANLVTVDGTPLSNGTGFASNYSLAGGETVAARITPATLTYAASPVGLYAGRNPPSLTGTVIGFVAGESVTNSTTGSLTWTTAASSSSQPGQYLIEGGGLRATNYVFVQAPGNTKALTIVLAKPEAAIQPLTVQHAAAVQLSYLQSPTISGSPNSGSGGGYTTSMGTGTTLNTKLNEAGGTNFDLRIENPGVRLPAYALTAN